jgi:hypothetical protein
VIADAHLDPLPEVGHLEPSGRGRASFAPPLPPLLVAGVGLQLHPLFVELERRWEGTLREAPPV